MSSIQDVQTTTDTYLASTYNNLQAGASISAVNTVIDNAVNNKESVMTDIFNNLESSTHSYQNGIFYKQRNDELAELQDAVVARTVAEKEAYDQDKENAKRQVQINEWSAYNKLDSLFISQLLFISLVFLAPLLYLKTRFLIPSNVFYGIFLLIVIIFIFTVTWRVQYTDNSRSKKFWHRRTFGTYSQTPSSACNA